MTVERLPLLTTTPSSWARLAAANLPVFLSDHAVCEQQAALAALALVGHYPDDAELVERMTALAAEEISHLR
ncbi:MAG: tRNA isopentenyl-2-thiomethyl-A-37 hydroxylase MiaE, partial [Acidobacteriota bacterium]|nr:tRNA isopentenyl-2-thiomethyl-A-37 hydroxylase MiaE [Acidobacteriota bacterium]